MLTDRQAFILSFIEEHPEKSQGQIADILGIRREAVNRLIARAKQRRDAERPATQVRRRVVRMGDMAA